MITKLHKEHQELYKDLELMLLELSKLKTKRDDFVLVDSTQKLLDYVDDLLANHFSEEDKEIFPKFIQSQPELIKRLITDHQEIENKNKTIKTNLAEFKAIKDPEQIQNYDWQKQILYPAYNLIATINHHALREDRELFSGNNV